MENFFEGILLQTFTFYFNLKGLEHTGPENQRFRPLPALGSEGLMDFWLIPHG
jgi:hypothetical protein